MNDPERPDLKQRLLPGLIGELDRVRERRRAIRRAWAAGAILLALGTVLWVARPAALAPLAPISTTHSHDAAFISTDAFAIREWSIATTPLAPADILLSQPSSAITERLGDEALLALLASIGRPTGLARLHGRVLLTTPVADPLPISPG
jgi:hypothetical protein